MKALSEFLLNLFLIAAVILIGFMLAQKYQVYKDQVITESIAKAREVTQQSELNNKLDALQKERDLLQKENDSLKEKIQKDQLAFQNQKQSPDYTEKLNQLSNQVLELSNRKFVVEVPPTKDSTTPFLLNRIKALENENKILEESMNLKERTLVNKNIEESNSYKSKIEYYVRLDEYNKSKIKQLEQQIATVKPVVRCDSPPTLTNSVTVRERNNSTNSLNVPEKKLSKSDKKSKQVDQLN